jgi:hypothetical protein
MLPLGREGLEWEGQAADAGVEAQQGQNLKAQPDNLEDNAEQQASHTQRAIVELRPRLPTPCCLAFKRGMEARAKRSEYEN